MTPPVIVDKQHCVEHRPFPGVRMFTTEGQHMTVSIVEMEPGAVIPEHAHPHEQVGYLLEGEFDFTIGGETHHVVPGQMWRIPGGVPHKVVAGQRAVRAIDVFYPLREDMRTPRHGS